MQVVADAFEKVMGVGGKINRDRSNKKRKIPADENEQQKNVFAQRAISKFFPKRMESLDGVAANDFDFHKKIHKKIHNTSPITQSNREKCIELEEKQVDETSLISLVDSSKFRPSGGSLAKNKTQNWTNEENVVTARSQCYVDTKVPIQEEMNLNAYLARERQENHVVGPKTTKTSSWQAQRESYRHQYQFLNKV